MRSCHTSAFHQLALREDDDTILECRAGGVFCCSGPFITLPNALEEDQAPIRVLHGKGQLRVGKAVHEMGFFAGTPAEDSAANLVAVCKPFEASADGSRTECEAVVRGKAYGKFRTINRWGVQTRGVHVAGVAYGKLEVALPKLRLRLTAAMCKGTATGQIHLFQGPSIICMFTVQQSGDLPIIAISEKLKVHATHDGLIALFMHVFKDEIREETRRVNTPPSKKRGPSDDKDGPPGGPRKDVPAKKRRISPAK